MKIDTHIHTSHYSACGKMTADELLIAARDRELSGLIITEHMVYWPDDEWAALQQKAGDLTIFRGVEVYGADDLHYLVFGLITRLPLDRRLPLNSLADIVHAENGFIALAHPFHNQDALLPAQIEKLDGVEVMSPKMPTEALQCRCRDLARRCKAAPIAGSDAHAVPNVGRYGIELDRRVTADADLLPELWAGRFRLFAHAGNAADA
jgi:hypothetical protein